ncbi:MAG TPA: SgcJ/EcaC family oxidoreductase [Candidatus Acidoferrales bacterium]|nr:SgcJ/EcaC family oxidoreductase [Candidatus Acidoferrales bacterium]
MTRASMLFAAFALVIPMLATSIVAAPDETENVRNVVAAFATTWNRHDMEAFGKLFTPDAEFVNVAGTRWVGRREIQAQHAYSHGTIPQSAQPKENLRYYGIFKHSTMTFTHIDVRFLRKDVALAHVDWELSGDTRTQGLRRGVFTFVLTQQNGGWLIAAAQNTEINRTVK